MGLQKNLLPLAYPPALLLLVFLPLLRLSLAWDCPVVKAPPVPAAIDVPEGYQSLTSYFTLGFFNTLQATDAADCQLQAYYQACVNNQTAFFMFSDTALTTDPATFNPANCLVGVGCVSSPANGTTPIQMGALKRCGKTCGGTAQTKKQLKCPKHSIIIRREWCAPYPYICVCAQSRIEHRDPSTGRLLRCTPKPQA